MLNPLNYMEEWNGHLGSAQHSQRLGWEGPRILREGWATRLHHIRHDPPRQRDRKITDSVLNGEGWSCLPREPHRCIRFMISSTFTVRLPVVVLFSDFFVNAHIVWYFVPHTS
jgi:hypothetical protein